MLGLVFPVVRLEPGMAGYEARTLLLCCNDNNGVGSNPTRCWAFPLFYPLSNVSLNKYLKKGLAYQISLLNNKCLVAELDTEGDTGSLCKK